MNAKTSLDPEILAQYEAVTHQAQAMTFLPRASDLQEAAVKEIDSFLETLAGRKAAYVEVADEDRANFALGIELTLRALQAELGMWLRLKQEDPDGAWDHLVTAQQSLEAAIAVRQQLEIDVSGLVNLSRKLLFIECWVFPPQMFFSTSGIAPRRACSICGADYDGCDHVRGRAYMGQVCRTIVQQGAPAEVTIVPVPDDKHCRITHFNDQGKTRNAMTWRLEDHPAPAG
jgi:hypothetical protein